MNSHELVEVEITDPVEVETPKAIMFTHEGEEFWIPKSQIGNDSEVQGKGDTGTLIIPEWLAEEKGLI